jgi:hypothetical protein
MKLERLELLQLRADDGLSTPEERRELQASGADVAADIAAAARLREVVTRALAAPPLSLPGERPFVDCVLEEVGLAEQSLGPALRDALYGGAAPELADSVLTALSIDDGYRGAQVAGALRDGAGETPELGAPVVKAVGLADPASGVGDAVRHALDGGETPELVGSVLRSIAGGEPGATVDVGETLRSALDGGIAPELADDVLAALGLAAATSRVSGGTSQRAAAGLLSEALADAAGDAPDLTLGVMGALGLEDAAAGGLEDAAAGGLEDAGPGSETSAPESGAVVVPFWPRARRWTMAAGLAAAAAAVLAVVGLPGVRPSDPVVDVVQTIHFETVNQIQIEEISADPGAIVQVLQFDENAPAIIFIDVLEEPDGDAGSEGVPL